MSKASLSPEGFVVGGGLIDDVNVTFKDCRFEMFDYEGKVIPGVPSLKVNMVTEEDEESAQNYSMGSAQDWAPSENGKELMSVGKATAIRTTCNGGIFLQNLVDAGFPADDLGTDISVLDGLKVHVIRIPAPERPGLKKKDKRFEDTILVVDDILALPGEKAKSKTKSKTKAKGKDKAKDKAPDGDAPDVNDKAVDTVVTILAGNDGSVTKKALPGKIFQVLKTDPDRNEVIKVAFEDDFLSDETRPWTYEDGTLTM